MSKSKKYRVSVDGRFLGHYPGHGEKAAVEKAIQANYKYHKDWIDNAAKFEVKRGSEPEKVIGVA